MSCASGCHTAVFERVEPRVLFAISFQPPVHSTLMGLNVMAAADFNKDGFADVIARGRNETTIRFFPGTGDGHFASLNSTPPINAGPSVVSLATGDFNRDGYMDFVAADAGTSANAGSVTLMLGNGHGNFQAPIYFAAGPDPTGIAVADLNRDGKLDVVVSNNGSWSSTSTSAYGGAVLYGTNAGFGSPMRITLNFPSTAVAIGQAPVATSVSVAMAASVIAFAGPNLMTASPLPMTSIAVVPATPMNTGYWGQYSVVGINKGLASVEMNKDQRPDVAALQVLGANSGANTTTSAYTISSRLPSSSASGIYTLQGPYETGLDSGFGIVAGDFDRDGFGDVAVAGTRSLGPMLPAFTGSVAALAGTGGGALSAPKTLDVGAIPAGIAAAQVDRDGRLDVITTDSTGICALRNASPMLRIAEQVETIFSVEEILELALVA